MEEKLQAKNVRIVLFFSRILDCNSVKLANSLMERLSELGQPNIFNIPEEAPNDMKMQMPKIIFSNSKEINVTVTNVNINISVDNDNVEIIKTKIHKIYEALKENLIDIQAIGVVSQYLYYDINFEKIKSIYFKEQELTQSDLVNMSWYKKEDNINIWKTIKVEEKDNLKNLTVITDINNIGTNKVTDIDVLKEFLDNQYKKVNDFKGNLEEKIGE